MKCGYIDIADGQIHYKTKGTGTCIVFLHQSPLSSDEYTDLIPLISDRFHKLAFDSMGHGNSSDPPREFDIEDFARTTIDALNKLGITRVSLVGHHTGALIAVEIAAVYPDRVEKLILSGCPVYSPEEWKTFLSQPMTRDIPMTEDGSFLVKAWQKYHGLTPDSSLQTCFKPFIIALKSRTRPYDAHFAAGRYIVKPKLGMIKAPTLLVSGDKDMFINQLDSTRRLIRNCTTSVIKGGGLFLNFEVPGEFARAISDFMRRQKG